jgi:hypothetical protein
MAAAPRTLILAVVLIDLVIVASIAGANVLAARLLAAASPEPAWLATAIQDLVIVSSIVIGGTAAALGASKLAAAMRTSRKARMRAQHASLFHGIDQIVGRLLAERG